MNNATKYLQLVKWIFRLLSGIAIAVIYFFVFSFFFDTPIEYELKKSTRRLSREYRELSRRYDTLQLVLDNVVDRDKGVYKILFEAEPQMPIDADRMEYIELYERLDSESIRSLENYFEEKYATLTARMQRQEDELYRMEGAILSDQAKAMAIPAMQPVANSQLTLLTASFGERIHPFFKTMTQHNGVDYSVPVGTAVFATADGHIKSLQTRGQTTGLSIVIDHGNGYETVYAHLDKVVAAPGRRVSRGDIIAFSGNSGLSFAPHLHYEVRFNGKAVDPLDYFFMELDAYQAERLRAISQMGMQSFD